MLGLVPIYIGINGVIYGLERLVSDAVFSSTADGQYRYLSAIYLGFGCLLLWIQAHLESEIQLFRILMLTVFVAGVARSLPLFEKELPGTSILIALAFELIAPPLLILWHRKALGSEQS